MPNVAYTRLQDFGHRQYQNQNETQNLTRFRCHLEPHWERKKLKTVNSWVMLSSQPTEAIRIIYQYIFLGNLHCQLKSIDWNPSRSQQETDTSLVTCFKPCLLTTSMPGPIISTQKGIPWFFFPLQALFMRWFSSVAPRRHVFSTPRSLASWRLFNKGNAWKLGMVHVSWQTSSICVGSVYQENDTSANTNSHKSMCFSKLDSMAPFRISLRNLFLDILVYHSTLV